MSVIPAPEVPRCAIVELGSNSVRLVVYEGLNRNPVAIFNEKSVLRLGRGLQSTGRLHEDGMARALTVMQRYYAVARTMGAEPMEVLATSAVRDASNGADFVAVLRARMPNVPIHILSGEQEATFSVAGVLSDIPAADGVLADMGGGSLELVRLDAGHQGSAQTLSLGVIRLEERAGGDRGKARAIVEAELDKVPWLAEGSGRDLYLVGGVWRALARIHIAQTSYPLPLVHRYTISREEARDLTEVIATSGRRALERLPGILHRRIDDLPFAAITLRRLLRATGVRRVVFSANGMREGWFMRRLPDHVRAEDPLLAVGHDYARRFSRDPSLPRALLAWTDSLFPHESGEPSRLREAACWISDIGSHDHPEFRAEQAFLRVLRQPGSGMDHHARAFLALATAIRYDADLDAPFLRPARMLLDVATAHRATVIGFALRLAYVLSAGTSGMLASTSLSLRGKRLLLCLAENAGVFAGESVLRGLDRLAQELGLDTGTEAWTPTRRVVENVTSAG